MRRNECAEFFTGFRNPVRDDSGYRRSAGSGCASCAFSDLGKESIRKEWRAGAACLDLCEGIWYDVRTREALRITDTATTLDAVGALS